MQLILWSGLQIEMEQHCPASNATGEPLSEGEMNIIRQTLKELKGAARVWDVLSQERITHRTSKELRELYYQQGYGAAGLGVWRKTGQNVTQGENPPALPICQSFPGSPNVQS